jgi:hypothetical protein
MELGILEQKNLEYSDGVAIKQTTELEVRLLMLRKKNYFQFVQIIRANCFAQIWGVNCSVQRNDGDGTSRCLSASSTASVRELTLSFERMFVT